MVPIHGNLVNILSVEVTLTLEEVTANTTEEQTFTLNGVKTTDKIMGVSKPTHQAGLLPGPARVSAANTVALHLGNLTGSGITPTAGETWTVFVAREEGKRTDFVC